WVEVDCEGRVRYLEHCIRGVLDVSETWVREACRRKQIDPVSPEAGEEWLSGPMTTIRTLRLYANALRENGRPKPAGLRPGPGGRTIARVFPTDLFDRFLYYNITGDLWIQPGQPASQGRIYRDKAAGRPSPGKVTLVLGAGNIASIAPLDVAHKLFVEDQVVVLKMNPVNEYLGPILERAFGSLVDDGYLAVTYGDKETGRYLSHHDLVSAVHLTGSDRTYDAIVWGETPEEQNRRRSSGDRLLDKTVTAELGCVTPVIVVPGNWSSSDVDYQARHVTSMVAHNASFNCTAAKVLILPRDWSLRGTFLDRLRVEMRRAPARYAYYPGASERYREFRDRYPQAEPLGEGDGVPWTLIPDVDPDADDYALTREAFCGVLAEVSLPGEGPAPFLDAAVSFANDRIWGDLSCVVLVDGATRRAHATAVDDAIARLEYGGIGINAWTGVNFGLGATSWGPYPGNAPEKIGSGIGAVHNSFMFDHPEKSVVSAPFHIRPKPVWFAGHRSLDTIGRLLTRFEAKRSLGALIRIAAAGLRG
ncbi:MAG: aldehyde dehydrogenase family protein, partial [Acidobacteriota bacterium]|nr:aldehyde dehydrogenase family protein [Acidobacteriota bacterium]